MRHRAWSLLLAVPAVLFVVVSTTAPFTAFHQHLTLAGTPGRFASTVVRAGRSNARGALWLDNVFVLSWLLVVPRVARLGLERWAPERRRMVAWWEAGPRLALYAGIGDLVENALALALVGKRRPPTGLTLALATVTWMKSILYVAAIVALLALVVGPVVAPVLRPTLRRSFGLLDRLAGSHPPPTPPEEVVVRPDGERLGITLSGGGIRAASVALGLLRGLDTAPPDGTPSVFRRARWLVAVSGGSYTAGGWRISRRPGNRLEPVGDDVRDGLFAGAHPWAATVRARRHYLRNGALGFAGGLLNVLGRLVLVFGAVLSATYVLGFVLGEAVPTRAVHPWFPYGDQQRTRLLGARELVPMRLVVPGVAVLVVALVLRLVARRRATSAPARRSVFTPGVVAMVGGALLVVLVGVPAGVVYGARVMDAIPVPGGADGGASVLGVIATLVAFGALVGIALAEAKVRWMRLGGVVLAVGLVLFGGKIADAAARQQVSLWRSWPIGGGRLPLVVVAVVWLLVVDAIASHRLTLGGVYRKRLAATFALADGSSAPLAPLAYSLEPRWSGLSTADGPELIVSATAHSSTPGAGGVKGHGFTFRPSTVALHDRHGSSALVPMAEYPRGSWWDGFPRGWIVSRSMALSGAAIASAMGRQALGTTNALLAALDLRLGAWVPNPRHAQWFDDPDTSPRVHLGYLWKELVGRYHPDRDAFVYVADGGHRENLGLVELLRERPATVLCLDASGAEAGSSTTLDEAIELAHDELGVAITIDLRPLQRPASGLPAACVAVGGIAYPDAMGGGEALLVYGRAQVDATAPAELIEYARTDRRFPDYSTLDQFLTDTEHVQLVALGEHLAACMRDAMGGSIPGATP